MSNDVEIKRIVDIERQKLLSSNIITEEATHLFTIVNLSFELSTPPFNECYTLFKQYILKYAVSFRNAKLYYDDFNKEVILQTIYKFPLEFQVGLLSYLCIQLKSNHLEDHVDSIENILKKKNLHIAKNNISCKTLFPFLKLCSTYNFPTVCITILISFGIFYTISLPAPFDWLILFETNSQIISKNMYLNHLNNLLLEIFDLNDDKYLKPINFAGTLTLVITKITLILFIADYLWKELKIKIKE